MLSLLASKNSNSFTLQELNDKHSLYALKDAVLSVFPDVSKFKGDPSRLKSIISGDLIGARQLYKDKIAFNPKTLVLITSNMLWEPNDPTNGLQRRFIYIKVDNSPKELDRNLLNYKNGSFEGTLYDNLPGLVNWALSTTPEELNFLNQETILINNAISPGLTAEINPLVHWIEECIRYMEGNKVFVGNKLNSPQEYLFSNYLKFCALYDYKPLSSRDFSNALIQQLKIIFKNYQVLDKKTKKGRIFYNIQLLPINNFPLNAAIN